MEVGVLVEVGIETEGLGAGANVRKPGGAGFLERMAEATRSLADAMRCDSR